MNTNFPALINISECSDVTKTLIMQLVQRDQHGRKKYGVTLDRKDLTPQQWLQHMTEELLDGAGYAQAAIREIELHIKQQLAEMDELVETTQRNIVAAFGPLPLATGCIAKVDDQGIAWCDQCLMKWDTQAGGPLGVCINAK